MPKIELSFDIDRLGQDVLKRLGMKDIEADAGLALDGHKVVVNTVGVHELGHVEKLCIFFFQHLPAYKFVLCTDF